MRLNPPAEFMYTEFILAYPTCFLVNNHRISEHSLSASGRTTKSSDHSFAVLLSGRVGPHRWFTGDTMMSPAPSVQGMIPGPAPTSTATKKTGVLSATSPLFDTITPFLSLSSSTDSYIDMTMYTTAFSLAQVPYCTLLWTYILHDDQRQGTRRASRGPVESRP